jgi:hypothetical protein
VNSGDRFLGHNESRTRREYGHGSEEHREAMKPWQGLVPCCFNAKEGEMREDVKENVPSRFTVMDPLKLHEPKLPDLDVAIEEAEDSTLLIGELKWLRKAVRALEYLDRDAELVEGFQQLLDVREFLEGSPDFLEERGVAKKGEHQPNFGS